MFDSTLRVPGSATQLLSRPRGAEKQRLQRRPSPRRSNRSGGTDDSSEGIPLEPITPQKSTSSRRRRNEVGVEDREGGSVGLGNQAIEERQGVVEEGRGVEASGRDNEGGGVEMGREAETSFETAPTWYIDAGLSESSR